jgi:magnesium-transporting ATPase (P-type)
MYYILYIFTGTCIRNDYFHPSVFWRWILQAFIESTILSVLPLYFLVDNYNQDDFWSAGATCFTAVVLIVNIKIFFLQSNWYWLNYIIIALSVGSWFVVAYIITNVLFIDYNWFHLFDKLTVNPIYWLTVLLLVTLITAKDLYISSLERYFNYKPYHILQEIETSKFSCKSVNIEKEVELRDLSLTSH